ncbi:P12 family lipoprotein (plasmid) [Borrelia coriaceae]|nr:P12 family lipoprotein [Borrelia coriaceae]UPA17149.1 P12 family lipoprotein [Borrelia coriaceae]
MKKNIFVIYMLTLLCLLSCDINALNELLGKAKEKFLEENKDIEDLKSIEKNQEVKEKQIGIVKKIEEGVQQVVQAAPVVSVGASPLAPVDEVFVESVSDNNAVMRMYSQQEKIEIKKEDLVARTDEEKKAQVEIEKVENLLEERSISFLKLIDDAHNLKSEYEQVNAELYDITKKIQDEIRLLGADFKNNRYKRQSLSQLQGRLRDEIFNLEGLMSTIDIAIVGMTSSRLLFEKAKETLKESITRRLQRASNRYLIREYELTRLSRDARRYAESSLDQVLTSAMKVQEGKSELQRIKEFIEGIRTELSNL